MILNVNRSEEIKNEILKKLFPDIGEKEFILNEPYSNYVCFLLWYIKTHDNITSFDELEENSFFIGESDFPPLGLHDVVDAFRKNKVSFERLASLKNTYSKKELTDAVLNSSSVEDFPSGIAAIVNEILGITSKDTVLEVGCDYGAYLILTDSANHASALRGLADDYMGLTDAFVMSSVLEKKKITYYNIEELIPSDKVFVNAFEFEKAKKLGGLLYGAIEYEKPDFPYENSGWNICMYGILSQQGKGRTVAVMNSRDLTIKSLRDVREYFCKSGYIEGVIALSDKMYDNTWVNSYIVIFGENNDTVKFFDARHMHEARRKKGKRVNEISTELAKKIYDLYKKEGVNISVVELKTNDYSLNPVRYTAGVVDNVKKIRLGEVLANIGRGKEMPASKADKEVTDEFSHFACVTQSSISEGIAMTDKYYHGDKVNDNNVAMAGDVLLSKAISPVKAAVSKETCIVIGNIYILRFKEDSVVSPEYVKCFLESDYGQEIIRGLTSGSNSKYITVENINNIEIPVYQEDTQNELNLKAKEMIMEIEEYYIRLKETRQEINELFK